MRIPPLPAVPALAVLALAAFALAAAAQPAPPTPAPANGVVIVPLRELPDADSFGERVDRMWTGFLDMFRFGWRHSQYARSHTERDLTHFRTRDDFGALMDVAGYKLKEIESHVGIAPGLQMSFLQVRELTEADREYVERRLLRHARRNPGTLAAIQRLIVRSVVEASDIAGFAVEKVVIDLFPLPEVKFVIASVDAPLGLDAARIMRAIEGLNRQIQQTSRASGSAGADVGEGPAGRLAAQ